MNSIEARLCKLYLSGQNKQDQDLAPNAKQVAHLQRGQSRQQKKTTPPLACAF
jgi:hypothetical protein